MDILQAIILGIIEGLTEFLPISSTGHLIVSENLLGYKDSAEIFTVVIQMGAIGAVIWHYKQDLFSKVRGLVSKNRVIKAFWINWIIATIPAGVIAFLLRDQFNKYAISEVVAISLIIGGVLIWLIETHHKITKNSDKKAGLDSLTKAQALKVGLFQVIAIIPGVSRSGATIMGGLLSGLDRVTATTFSFYLSIPIILVAGTYQLTRGDVGLDSVSGGLPALTVGIVASFVTALIAIKWLLKYVSIHNFKIFAYYRIVFGLIILFALYL